MARSIAERLESLEHRGDELAGTVRAALNPVHVRTVEVMTELLSLADRTSTTDTPPMMRTLLGTLKRVRPMLEAQLANVPEATIVEFMGQLRDKMTSIIDQAEEGAAHDQHADPAVSAKPR